MNHYLDISILPDPEFGQNALMNALFSKLHLALVAQGEGNIGVSFPHADKNLGDCLRLHGEETNLERLMDTDWFKGLQDHCEAFNILPVPKSCQHRVIKRVSVKSSPERLYRRSVKKGWLKQEEANKRIKQAKAYFLKLPYVQLKSASTGQRFRLFIHIGELQDNPVPGTFSSYGLSNQATVPWF